VSEVSTRGTDSPLKTERGSTRIDKSVVAKIAGLAAQEVEGVHMGGGTTRAASGLVQRASGGSASGPADVTRGVSVEVGEVEAAIDLKMDVEYGRNILATVEQVRTRITDQVRYMTGLRITELNATINDVIPAGSGEGQGRLRRRLGGSSGRPELGTSPEGIISPSAREVRTSREIRPGIRDEGTVEVEPRRRTRTDLAGDPAREEVRVEEHPLDEGETAELRPGTGEVEVEGETRGGSRRGGPREGGTSDEVRDVFETRTDRGTGERGSTDRGTTEGGAPDSGTTGRGTTGGGDEGDEPRSRRRRRDR